MTTKTKAILDELNQAGAFNRVRWQRAVKTRKGIAHVIEKRVSACVATGVDYAHRKSIKEAIANGERGPVQPLPWGEWDTFPYVIRHTNKQGEYREYIRLYPPTTAQANVFDFGLTAEYLLDGNIVDKATIAPMVLASELQSPDLAPECLTVKSEDVYEVCGKLV